MLRRLAGRTHTVFTGLALRCVATGLKRDTGEASEVTFKAFDEDTISAYLSRVHTLDKAGGYGIQDHGDLLVAGYTGSLSNIIGLPLDTTKQILVEAGLLR
jgi:septum formation protein